MFQTPSHGESTANMWQSHLLARSPEQGCKGHPSSANLQQRGAIPHIHVDGLLAQVTSEAGGRSVCMSLPIAVTITAFRGWLEEKSLDESGALLGEGRVGGYENEIFSESTALGPGGGCHCTRLGQLVGAERIQEGGCRRLRSEGPWRDSARCLPSHGAPRCDTPWRSR